MKRSVILLASLALALVACATPTPPPPPTPALDNPFAISGTKWTLVSITLDGVTQTPNGPNIPTLEFEDGQLGGTGGCNNFGGTYTAQGEILSIQALQRTLMACSPDEIMTLEDVYLSALESARLFEKRGDQLSITFGEGGGMLLFQARQ